MINIVFGESAGGAMKCAREFGSPLIFSLFLSIGDISGQGIGSTREATLRSLFSHCPADIGSTAAREIIETASANLSRLLSHLKEGKAVRIWYSRQPDELCGLCWLLAQIADLPLAEGQIRLVKLPGYESRGDMAFLLHTHGWSGIPPEEFAEYLRFETTATREIIDHCALMWKNLQSINTPLRATVNSMLLSVPIDFYDCFLRLEISRQPATFRQAMVIGGVIGRHGLGICDGWLSLRMEEMIRSGELEVEKEAPDDHPRYHRMLKKART